MSTTPVSRSLRSRLPGTPDERAPRDGHRDRVRHLGAGPARRQPDGGLLAGRQRLRQRDAQGPARPLGLRGGVAAARRPRLRHVPRGRRPDPAHRRGPRPRQRHPHQRRPALRRPRAPGVLHARVHQPARHRALGQGRRAGHARRLPVRRGDPGGGADPAVQEQHRQQGRVVRRPRELPDAAQHAVRRDRPAPDAVLRQPPGRHRRRPGRHRPGRPRARLPGQPARRLLRGRGRARDHAEAADHQHPRRAARRPGEVPPAARHHRRRQPGGDLDLPQGRARPRWCWR